MVRLACSVTRWGAFGAVAIGLASCSSTLTIPRAQGLISGVAANCSTARHPRPVTVVVLEDSTMRTSATIRSGAHFVFHLAPGHYVISTGAHFSRVTLGAGGRARVDFPASCARQAP